MNRHERRAERKRGLKIINQMIESRPCGACSACCYTMGIPELNKPNEQRCQWQGSEPDGGGFPNGGGCNIYTSRPPSCKAFVCAWKALGQLPELTPVSARPDQSGVVLDVTHDGKRTLVAREAWPGALETPRAQALINSLCNSGRDVIIARGEEEDGLVIEEGYELRGKP